MPNIRKGPGIAKKIQQEKECPRHKKPLLFDPSTGYWHCPEFVCNYKLVPKADAERGSASVAEGPFELFVYKDKDNVTNYLIRSLKHNLIFDVTDHVKSVRGTGAKTTIEMTFDKIAIKE